MEKTDEIRAPAQPTSSDTEDGIAKVEDEPWDWETDPHNPYNWSSGKKAVQVGAIASIAFLA